MQRRKERAFPLDGNSPTREHEIESKRLIRNAAYRLFLEEGYDDASYSAIAAASKLGRPLVQKHFPKKEQLLCDLVEDTLVNCIAILGEKGLLGRGVESDALRIAQTFYSTLLRNAASIRLARQAFTQERVSAMVVIMLSRHMHEIGFKGSPEELQDSIMLAMGGVGHLAIDKISRDIIPDADHLAVLCVSLLLVINRNANFAESKAALRKELLERKAVETIIGEVMDRVLVVGSE